MATATKIIDKARSYIGVKESPAGSNNVIFNTDYYGHPVYGSNYHWCCTFVWDIFRMCGASNLFYNGQKTASCTTVLRWAEQCGLIVNKSYGKKGDIILFDWDGSGDADHIGLIVGKNSDGTYTTVEGNTAVGNDSNGGQVMERRRGSCIRAVIRPQYEPEHVDPIPPNKPTKPIKDYRVNYRSHVQTFGWLGTVGDGETSGTVGQSLRLEAVQINIPGHTVTYQVHQQGYGDSAVAKNGETCGVTGEAKRVEAIRINCKDLKVEYRANIQGSGWTEWCKNNQWCGTKGKGLRLEAIQVRIANDDVKYKVHQQTYGWTDWVYNGAQAGRTGESKRLEAVIIDGDAKFKYQIHQQTYGDSKVFTNGQQAGVTGESKRLESIKIDCNKKIKYRVHQQGYGWLPWVDNGCWCGVRGQSKRIESLEIKFV